jgi:hypothetical protein
MPAHTMRLHEWAPGGVSFGLESGDAVEAGRPLKVAGLAEAGESADITLSMGADPDKQQIPPLRRAPVGMT